MQASQRHLVAQDYAGSTEMGGLSTPTASAQPRGATRVGHPSLVRGRR